MGDRKKKEMAETPKHQSLSSKWWWLDCPSSIQQKRSPWLQSTISELDEKTKAILKLIEEDADSFAQRAEMYYKKRPELITMVEDFYRTQRSLAERCDHLKSESRLLTPQSTISSSSSSSLLPIMSKCQPEKLLLGLRSSQKDYDSYSESYELYESDVDDDDHYEPVIAKRVPFDHGSSDLKSEDDETDECEESDVEDPPEPEENEDEEDVAMVKLREEMERLEEENMTQKEKLMEKDEEKREVIRQLSVAMDMLREENVKLKQSLAAATKNSTPKKRYFIWDRIFP